MDDVKEFFNKFGKYIALLLAVVIAYAGGNIKTFGDLVSFIGAQEASNKAAVETLENNTGGEVAVSGDDGQLIDPTDVK